MKTIKYLFTIAACFMALQMLGPSNLNAQQTREHVLLLKTQVEPQAAGYLKIQGIDGECDVKEGRNVIGVNTRAGEQIIVVISNGRVSQVGTRSKGTFTAGRVSTGNPCASLRCSEGSPTCYILPSGECICVCQPTVKKSK